MYELDPDRVVFDVTEIEEVIAERDEALARVEELTSELTAYQVGDSDRSLVGETEWADVLALRRISAEGLQICYMMFRGKLSWMVVHCLGPTLHEALAAYDKTQEAR